MVVDLEALLTGEDTPELLTVVEIRVGSRNKYEPEMWITVWDRVLPDYVRFLAGYGVIPSTMSAADVEPLDTAMFTLNSVFSGCLVQARVVGTLEVVEAGNTEYNIFAVPDKDPRFDDIDSLEDPPDQNLREVEQFYVTSRQMERDEQAETRSWHGLENTYEVIHDGAQERTG